MWLVPSQLRCGDTPVCGCPCLSHARTGWRDLSPSRPLSGPPGTRRTSLMERWARCGLGVIVACWFAPSLRHACNHMRVDCRGSGLFKVWSALLPSFHARSPFQGPTRLQGPFSFLVPTLAPSLPAGRSVLGGPGNSWDLFPSPAAVTTLGSVHQVA